ncbi:MAG: hypothetical protein ABR542_11185, partial [Desulfonatronovibrio sp.]
EKVIIRQAVQKFQVQEAKKVQGRGVFMIRKSLNFLKRRSNWEIFNSLSMLTRALNNSQKSIFFDVPLTNGEGQRLKKPGSAIYFMNILSIQIYYGLL